LNKFNDYTPFGVQMKNSFTATSSQRYKYNGKELDRMFGLDLYDYGARFYDARHKLVGKPSIPSAKSTTPSALTPTAPTTQYFM